jgi:hypothetical protein
VPGEDGQPLGGVAAPPQNATPIAPLPSAADELARPNLARTPIYDFDPDHRKRFHEATIKALEVYADQADDDRRMRRTIAGRVFWAIAVQVLIADAAFLVYGFWNHWNVPGSTINAWLVATVVQVFAVGLVITRSLFPAARALLQRAFVDPVLDASAGR